MRTTRVILGLVALGGCSLYSDDPTDISGEYVGNATYTIASGSGSGSVDAGSAAIELDSTDAGVDVAIGAACSLTASSTETLTILDNRNTTRFVFASDSIDASQTCTLPDGVAMTVAVGDLEVDHGGALTLDVGGATADGGYVVFQFAGAL
jgi:hypothetical protein